MRCPRRPGPCEIVYETSTGCPTRSAAQLHRSCQSRSAEDGAGGDVHRRGRPQRQQSVRDRQHCEAKPVSRASPIGQEIRINNVSFLVAGVLSRKGANMMGMDQDNVVLAPWTTIKYRVSGTTPTSTIKVPAPAVSISTSDTVNTLSNLYPSGDLAYPSRSSAGRRLPPAGALHQRRSNPGPGGLGAGSNRPSSQMTELLRSAIRIRPGACRMTSTSATWPR